MSVTEQWTSKKTFILATIGSAIGLGNIWRFPFKCYENGGSSFLIAYVIALLIAGVPAIVMELSLGHKYRLSAPYALSRWKKGTQWIGWWAVLIGFLVVCYYMVIMAWSLNYTVFAADLSWGNEPGNFFFNQYLHISEGPFQLGRVQVPVLIALLISWVLVLFSIWKGAKTVSKVVYITVVLPWLLLLVFVYKGVTLPGARLGLVYYLKPHFETLADPKVWMAAFGQVFYSLSIGFGIMMAYARSLPKGSDVIGSALIIALADAATAFIGGFAVFGCLGYYAQASGQAVSEVLKGGVSLAFVTYPTIINSLPASWLFGVMFFLMLLTLAVDSAFSLVESLANGLVDKFGWKHQKAIILIAIVGIALGLIFTTQAGLYWLDIVDRWLEFFGVAVIVLLECFVISWLGKADKLRKYSNSFSDVKFARWWDILVKFLIPAVLIALIISDGLSLFKNGYGDYPKTALLIGGWIPVFLLPIIALLIGSSSKQEKDTGQKVLTPQQDFSGKKGFSRFYYYLYGLLAAGAIVVIIGFAVPSLLTEALTIYLILALLGGAVYFSIITSLDDVSRKKWIQEKLDYSGEE
ncbi:MAG: sodium-dependent transporter [Candidatus Cloacimonetes bacterium]|nr:sodium-dependent transporter [Candidatus Cloacimonadota bacterium]